MCPQGDSNCHSYWQFENAIKEQIFYIGQSDISLTLNTYSHVPPSMQEEAANKMDEILVPIEVGAAVKQIKEPAPSFIAMQ